MNKHSRFKVQNDIQEEQSIGHTVKSNPRRAHVVIKEGNGHWQDKHVHDQHGENHEVPVQPGKRSIESQKGQSI